MEPDTKQSPDTEVDRTAPDARILLSISSDKTRAYEAFILGA